MRERFFAMWTLKEAYIKARGLGLAIPLKDFTLLPESPVVLRSMESPPQPTSDWQLERLSLPPPHAGAVALRSGGERLSIVTRSVVPLDSGGWILAKV